MNRFNYCLGNTTHLCDSGRQKLIQQVKLDSGYLQRSYPALRSKCIMGCIFNSVGLIITLKLPCIISHVTIDNLV
jgi:hypothetical protein